MIIRVTVTGTERARQAIKALGDQAPHATGNGLYRWAETVMADSKANYVPVDTGVLRGSGHVQVPEVTPTGASVTLGYGGAAAPYALAVHENPRAGKTGGWGPPNIRSGVKSRRLLSTRVRYKHWAATGQWKYLEEPVKRHAKTLGLTLAKALNAAMMRMPIPKTGSA